MICNRCNLKNATVHYRCNENGKVTDLHLCTDCAEKEGILYNGISKEKLNFESDSGFIGNNFGKLPFSALFGVPSHIRTSGLQQKVCTGCGLTENELRSSGKLGCEKCYTVFSELVYSMLNKMHMSVEYKGKIPERNGNIISISEKINKLKADMEKAVEKQEYEEAAKYRDMIKQLENSMNEMPGGENI